MGESTSPHWCNLSTLRGQNPSQLPSSKYFKYQHMCCVHPVGKLRVALSSNSSTEKFNKISKSKPGHSWSAFIYYSIFQSAQIWQHSVLPANMPYLPLLPSCRASLPFGWYSFYCPTEGRRLSRPGWLVTYRNKVPPRELNPDGHQRCVGMACGAKSRHWLVEEMYGLAVRHYCTVLGQLVPYLWSRNLKGPASRCIWICYDANLLTEWIM